MKLSDHDLLQIDEEYLSSLSSAELLAVSRKMLEDLKESRERLNRTPDNSSQPPSSRPAYLGIPVEQDETLSDEDEEDVSPVEKKGTDDADGDDSPGPSGSSTPSAPGNGKSDSSGKKPKGRAGKPVGAKGFGRTQIIPIRSTVVHRAETCAACDAALPLDARFTARIGYVTIDLIRGAPDQPGLRLEGTKHLFGEVACRCGHISCTGPGTGDRLEIAGRKTATSLSEWRIVGPMLAAFIVALAKRMRLSRSKVQEFLIDWFGLELSVGTIDNCIREVGLAAAPVQDELIAELRASALAHVDETPWKQKGQALWLWVFATANTVLFCVGRRTRQMVLDILTEEYAGWLMSDGLMNYRIFSRRLRCWAHLIRKAKGLSTSLDKESKRFGSRVLEVLEYMVEEVKDGSDPPAAESILEEFQGYCELYRDYPPSEKVRSLAVELLNDWDVIWQPVRVPGLPLTNNDAERALRHWVIARLISHGTRTAEGSRVLGVLASVIETCRLRNVSPWDYLAEVIAERRKGNLVPPLPAPVAA
ncbi:transposase IS66 [Magnetococcus marinus MC-1]|uniref:Transposase IS66 n=1 Tax=Magnetococcus marinus (strain ATCC BAA-1437 / JCM 17883 / MC-1) TaxID=156889 RepID=A0L4S4_MAGMM|nr:IS66-like element ISMasp4 family transposase [Magnetococcus marinus]ABK42967.1 transposase IS66 [Magnetococcus marinus MC-1]ABK43394.1 transposase IS66 [Magnetococcus marinus MC-1]ABK44013.1 transposase IS66 [Magnetococcus marinus MC-1]ABK44472.1 transposase IS66 [Magnetococcus marinus MC-1]ABK45878.1 transposase IS66 [Magnetococcus marinus MC-1]